MDSKLGNIKTDLITDGTNTIDAAGNVYLMTTGWVASLSASGIASGATSAEIVDKLSLGTPVWGEGVATSGGEHVIGWFVYSSQSYGLYYPDPYTELFGYEYLGAQDGEDSTVLNISRDYDWDGDGTLVQISGTFKKDGKEKIGKLALTNDIPPVVTPSTNATAGTAAAAKATGTALYTGFTEWEAIKIPAGWAFVSAWLEGTDWRVHLLDPNGVGDVEYIEGTPFDLSLKSTINTENDLELSRHLVTPTKTSQLVNDGSNGVPFALISDINDSMITDGTNTIDAAGNVYSVQYLVGDLYYSASRDFDDKEQWAFSDFSYVILSNQTFYMFRDDSGYGMLTYAMQPMSGHDGWYEDSASYADYYFKPNFTSTPSSYYTTVITNCIGKLALTNDIPTVTDPDFTTSPRLRLPHLPQETTWR